MNSLEDLVRTTFAERAHDVDGVTLDAVPAVRHPGRRWAAIGTVVAVAAAILVAVVVVAPWRGADHRSGPPAALDVATPPAGTQWVSFHGMTLTVPDSWRTRVTGCPIADVDSVIVVEPAGLPCPSGMGSADRILVTLRVDLSPIGHGGVVSGSPGEPDLGTDMGNGHHQVLVPDAGVVVDVYGADDAELEQVFGSIELTPVDHHGCGVKPPTTPAVSPGEVVFPDQVVAGTVCEYAGTAAPDAALLLLGSRPLTDGDLEELRNVVADADSTTGVTPGNEQPLGPEPGLHVYRLTTADGTVHEFTADPGTGRVVVSDGVHSAVATRAAVEKLPGAYGP